jgi:hypothetical protein
MLEGQTPVLDLLSDPGFSAINTKYKATKKPFLAESKPNL